MLYGAAPVKTLDRGAGVATSREAGTSPSLLVQGLVTDERGRLVVHGGALQPWTAAVAKAVTAPLPVRPVLERARLAWRGDLFLGVAVPMLVPAPQRTVSYYQQTIDVGPGEAIDPVFLYPLEPGIDTSGYFEALRALLDGRTLDVQEPLLAFARSVRRFNPSREEVEAIIAAIADFADAVKGMGHAVYVDVFAVRRAMLAAEG